MQRAGRTNDPSAEGDRRTASGFIAWIVAYAVIMVGLFAFQGDTTPSSAQDAAPGTAATVSGQAPAQKK